MSTGVVVFIVLICRGTTNTSLAPYASLSVRELTHIRSFGFPYAQSIVTRKIARATLPKCHNEMVSGCAALRQGGTGRWRPRRKEAAPRACLALRRSTDLWQFCRLARCGNARITCSAPP